jgi:hypothetical protein
MVEREVVNDNFVELYPEELYEENLVETSQWEVVTHESEISLES